MRSLSWRQLVSAFLLVACVAPACLKVPHPRISSEERARDFDQARDVTRRFVDTVGAEDWASANRLLSPRPDCADWPCLRDALYLDCPDSPDPSQLELGELQYTPHYEGVLVPVTMENAQGGPLCRDELLVVLGSPPVLNAEGLGGSL